MQAIGGYALNGVTVIATPDVEYLLDGDGNMILDGDGNPIISE